MIAALRAPLPLDPRAEEGGHLLRDLQPAVGGEGDARRDRPAARRRLAELLELEPARRGRAARAGSPSYLIDDASEIDEGWLDGVSVVGLTSGASAPEKLVTGVCDWFRARGVDDIAAVQPRRGGRRVPPPGRAAPRARARRAAAVARPMRVLAGVGLACLVLAGATACGEKQTPLEQAQEAAQKQGDQMKKQLEKAGFTVGGLAAAPNLTPEPERAYARRGRLRLAAELHAHRSSSSAPRRRRSCGRRATRRSAPRSRSARRSATRGAAGSSGPVVYSALLRRCRKTPV